MALQGSLTPTSHRGRCPLPSSLGVLQRKCLPNVVCVTTCSAADLTWELSGPTTAARVRLLIDSHSTLLMGSIEPCPTSGQGSDAAAGRPRGVPLRSTNGQLLLSAWRDHLLRLLVFTTISSRGRIAFVPSVTGEAAASCRWTLQQHHPGEDKCATCWRFGLVACPAE